MQNYFRPVTPGTCMNVTFPGEGITMKSDTVQLTLFATGWGLICLILSALITRRGGAPDTLVLFAIICCTPVLFRPLAKVMLFFRPAPFVLMKNRHRVWLHLNPWLCVGQPGLSDINAYWQALTDTLRTGLASPRDTLILSSHLLSCRRTARLVQRFPTGQYRYRILSRSISRVERTGLQIDTLLKEWRWYSPSGRCGVLVIRKKDKR